MNCRPFATNLIFSALFISSGLAAPVIDPIADVTIPAGKSLVVPVTATNANGRPLTYTVTSSTNGIAVVMHTNNPFWQMSVAQVADPNAPGAYQTPYRGGVATVTNVGNLTFMLFPEYAPHTVNVFQGLTTSGFYNSNTIFHRVISGFMIQGGDPLTNGTGGLVFTYDDEFNPQAMFSGNGQLALANSGKDTDGSQFFVTIGAQRSLDFAYPIFGQLVRGFDVLTNINNTAVDANDRPLADEIIQTASYVTDTADTVLTLTATNVPGVAGTITVIADDGTAGGRVTNVFAATLVADTNSNNQTFIHSNTVTNLVAPVNTTLTNFISAVELDGDELYWFPLFATTADQNAISSFTANESNNILNTLTFNVTNVDGQVQFFLVPTTNYVGTVSIYFIVSYNSDWYTYWYYFGETEAYDQQLCTFVFGDTPISGQSNNVTALAPGSLANVILATFTNGVPRSSSGNFTALINWGDDSTNSGVVTANAAGKKAVLGSHAYSYPGTYPVYVRVQSAIGASATIVSFVTVTNQITPATTTITVQTNGPGTLSTNYNNALLAVGGSYSITAIPNALCVLSSWTDGNGFALGTGTNLTFTVYTNMSLTANFQVITNPVLTVVYPLAGQLITNLYSSLATIMGSATNDATVTNVWYQVNSGGWLAASGTTNWSASFSPAYGVTNVIQAYAVNNFGYSSMTNTVRAKYLAGDVLTLATNGLGSITPNLNGDLLPLLTNYTLTATPASGFMFTNWTGSLTSTVAALQFTMGTNLTFIANFLDTNKPTLSITNPVAGQRVSNAVFVVMGAVSDNWQVSNVVCQLNGGAWSNAAPANGGSSWTATVNLIPGTNTAAAYAVDTSGNFSITSSVSFDFVATNQLQIRASGLGTVSPNYSNAWLEIGRNYSITSTPASGFVFTNWVTSTNWGSGAMTTKTNLIFMMASNLTLQVNFLDTNKPTVNITNLTAGQRVSNAVFTVKGTANDNWQVSNVVCQLNGGGWNSATNLNNWTNWAAGVTLAPGTNVVQAYAMDTSGNISTTSSVSFDFVATNQLQIRASGLGTISPNYSNAWLEIGRNYSITSAPASGFVFTNWVTSTNWGSGAMTTKTNLIFMMASNLTLQVNFLDVTKPTLSITAPAAGQHMTNALANVVGTASDNWKVSAVWYQLTNKILASGPWSLATTTNNYTNWTTTVTLAAGTNTVKAYAVDLGGNYSTTSSVSVLSSNTFKLQLDFAQSQPLTSTGLNFTLQISSNLNGHIQISTNLLTWATLTNFVGTNTTLNFRDPAATNAISRFYRAVIP